MELIGAIELTGDVFSPTLKDQESSLRQWQLRLKK